MNTIIIAGYFLISILSFASEDAAIHPAYITGSNDQKPAPVVSIVYPKHNQKVRGEVKIYGKARPGAAVKVLVTSTYFKKAYKGEKISKGEGPFKRMNRTFSVTADRNGTWILKALDLTNAGWEENFTIKASAEGKAVSVNVYDLTKPVNID